MSTHCSNDRSSLCSFTFVDDRHCRIPRQLGHPYLCAFHVVVAGLQTRQRDCRERPFRQLCVRLRSQLRPRTPLSAVAQGQVKPKTASTLAYLGQTLVQILPIAQHEYINAYDTDTWRETIRISHDQSAKLTSPDPPSPPPEPAPAPPPAAASDASPASE